MKSNSEFRVRPLGELCEVTGGSSAPQGEEFFRGGTIPFVRMRDLGAYHHTTQLDTTRDAVTQEAVEKKRLKIFEPGCILFPRSGSVQLNHRAILAIRASIVSHIGILQQFAEDIDVRYLYWFLVRYDMGEIAKQTTGLDLVNFSDVKKIAVPVPATVEEQRRIVAEIEKQFTRLEAGVAALRRVQANLKRYRAAILKAACEGQLAEPGAASPLPSSDGWEFTELGKVVTFSQGLQVPVPEQRFEPADGDVPFLRIVNYTQGDQDFRYITNPGEKYIVHEDEVVMVRYGAPGFVGRGFKGVLANNLFRITPKPMLSKPYLFYLLKSNAVADLIRSRQKGGTMQAISFGQLKDIPIGIPSLAEQTRIVAEVERRLSVVEELESVVSANLRRATRLRQSILQKAFTGELTS